MKRLRIVPEEQNNQRRFRWYHVLICSVLIAALFISMSVGLGYARYTVETDSLEAGFTVKADLFNASYVVAKRVPGEDTVLVSNDENIKVTVPATATGPEIDNAEYFLLNFTRQTADLNRYDYENKQNRITYVMTLRSMSYYNSDATTLPILVDENNSIEVELKVGHNAADFASISPSQASIPNEYDEENGVLRFVGLNRIGAKSGQFQIATNTFSANFDRSTVPADTSWYDDSYTTFIIHTAEELAGVAQLVNEGETDFSGKTIKLGDDISLYNVDNSKFTWEPIGNYDTPFRGSFDGDGHTISGLNLRYYGDVDEAKDRTCGLFGVVDGDGTTSISNLTLKNVSFSADLGVYADSASSGQAFGSLIGYGYGMNISDVHVDGLNVYGKSKFIGGILGRGDSVGIISDCSVENAVFGSAQSSNVGGVVGLQYGNGQDTNIKNCYVSAEINGTYASAGGIVGFGNSGAMGVENCYFAGSFTPSNDAAYCGGILGIGFSCVDKDYTINNCYADCTADLIGRGFFGYMEYEGEMTLEQESTYYGNNLVVANSSWSGDNDSFTWLSYAYDAGYDQYRGTVDKSDSCWFSAEMTYQQYMDALREHGEAPPVPTQAPTEAVTEAPTAAPAETPTEAATVAPTQAETQAD